MSGMHFRYCGIMRSNDVDKTEYSRIIAIAHNEQKEASTKFTEYVSRYNTIHEGIVKSMFIIKPQYRAAICYALCINNIEQFYLKVSVENQIIDPDNRSYDLSVITIKIFGFRDHEAVVCYQDMIRFGLIKLGHTFHGEIHGLHTLSKITTVNDTEYQFVVPHKEIDNPNEFWFLSTSIDK